MNEEEIIDGVDKDEMHLRQERVRADINSYISKKYPNLKDAVLVERPAKSRSVLDICGIRMRERGSGKPFFICLMGKCYDEREAIKITNQSTYNATHHLNCKHSVVACKTEAHLRNIATIKKHIEGADDQFKSDPARWFQVNLAAFACENCIAFRTFESPIWKVIASKLPTGNTSLRRINIRKHYVEHYVSIKENIIENINKAKEAYDIPFISLSLDLIQNEVQNKKMIGVRVSYVHDKELISYNIAVRGFNPTREEYDAKPASELLMDWCKLILREFKIDAEKHVLTSCTDSGSDVKKALEKVFPTMHEWCISHLTHLALADAFGSHVDPNKTKNSDMREFIGRSRKVIEKVNKSKTLKITLERKLLTDFGHNMKLRNSPSHRWSATEDVFVRLLKCWAQIRNAFVEEGIHFPLANDRTLLLELRSVIHPL
jgi:hypothetical protein